MLESKILIVEDEKNVGLTLVDRLRRENYDVVWAKSCFEAQEKIANGRFDLFLLDVGLPDQSGFVLAKQIKDADKNATLIFLTAFGTPEDRIQGLELGADDYIVKPFHFKELLLRIQNGLKHKKNLGNQIQDELEEVQIGQAKINFLDFSATVESQTSGCHRYDLSQKECLLLKLLLKQKGKVLSRDKIINEIWSIDEFPNPRTVDNIVLRLRKIIETNSDEPQIIKSVRGVGYYLI